MEEGRCTVGPSVVQASIGNSKGAKFTIVSRRCKIFIRFVLCPFILPFFLLPFFLDLEIERRAVFSQETCPENISLRWNISEQCTVESNSNSRIFFLSLINCTSFWTISILLRNKSIVRFAFFAAKWEEEKLGSLRKEKSGVASKRTGGISGE